MDFEHVLSAIRPLSVVGDASSIAAIDTLLTDSRLPLPTDPSSALFFAIPTAKDTGARYVHDLYQKGVRAFVVFESDLSLLPLHDMPAALVLVVKDVVLALQDLAAYKRSLYSCPVIAITGSNGKTVVKEWLYCLLRDDYRITRSPKSYNSQIGVPLSVWQMDETTDLAIFEAGISQPGEMERLERIIRPTLGVITYIGAEHGEHFADLAQKRSEKMRLFAHCDTIIEDPTHQNVRTCAAVLRALGYAEDEISRRIMLQTHETVLRVDLRAMVDNVRYFRSLMPASTRLTCMVKAFAYGAGSVEVSLALQQSGLVDYLAVAVADEGVELRRAGVTMPILIMDPEEAALDLILENNLQPNVYSFASLQSILRAAQSKGLEHYPIHIKIDSGMHRLGFYQSELPALLSLLNAQCAVRVASVFSHLAGSDESCFDAFTQDQIAYFRAAAATLEQGLGYTLIKHICNTAAIERFPSAHMDMCRLGIGLYGLSFVGAALKPVCSLSTTILSIKTVPAGESVGYSRRTILKEDRTIAVIPIGYADGFDRRFSNYGLSVLVRGKLCPVVGNVCMDQAMIDVTGVDAQVGDAVEIFGERIPLQSLADRLNTIPYEILTSVSRRVQRVYLPL